MSSIGAGIQFGSPQIPVKRARFTGFTCMLPFWALSFRSLFEPFTFSMPSDRCDGLLSDSGLAVSADLDAGTGDDGSYFDRLGGNSGSQLPLRKRTPSSRHDLHPRYNPSSVKCAFCREWGHSLMNCFKRLEHHWNRMETHCQRGFHKPHLHDCVDLWRCEWCLMHLHSAYVREHYPREYDFEIEKVTHQRTLNLRKYAESDSADS